MHENGIFTRILDFMKHVFLNGLFTVLPIAFTIFFINFAYRFVYNSLEPLRHFVPTYLRTLPGTEFIIATALILFVGIILRIFIIKSVIHYFEDIISSIPLIRIIYSSSKMLVDFFKISEDAPSVSRKVILIQYPRKGNYHIAFLLDSAEKTYQPLIPEENKAKPDEKYFKVFMPNSPNPTTGYFFILPGHEIVHTDITFEEAVKVLVSCGIITPDSLQKGRATPSPTTDQ